MFTSKLQRQTLIQLSCPVVLESNESQIIYRTYLEGLCFPMVSIYLWCIILSGCKYDGKIPGTHFL